MGSEAREVFRRFPHILVGATGTVVPILSRFILDRETEVMLGGSTNRAIGEHLLAAFSLPLLGQVFLDLCQKSENEKLRKFGDSLELASPYIFYFALTLNLEMSQIFEHGRMQWEQVAVDFLGMTLGMLGLKALDKLVGIPKRQWQQNLPDDLKKVVSIPRTRSGT